MSQLETPTGTKCPCPPAGPASHWTRDKSHLLSRVQMLLGQMACNKDLLCSNDGECKRERRTNGMHGHLSCYYCAALTRRHQAMKKNCHTREVVMYSYPGVHTLKLGPSAYRKPSGPVIISTYDLCTKPEHLIEPRHLFFPPALD